MLNDDVIKTILAPTDGTFRLEDYDPSWEGTADIEFLAGKRLKKRAKAYLKERREKLIDAQEKLYADDRYAILIILQAMDAAGKDSTIKHVMSGVNPQGCQVFSFKQPSAKELDHNFLWRSWQALPERGRIGIFNRSYYEEVLVVRVHPEFIEKQRLPDWGCRERIFSIGTTYRSCRRRWRESHCSMITPSKQASPLARARKGRSSSISRSSSPT